MLWGRGVGLGAGLLGVQVGARSGSHSVQEDEATACDSRGAVISACDPMKLIALQALMSHPQV